MLLKSEIISTNLITLESAKNEFPILIEYQKNEELKKRSKPFSLVDIELSKKSIQLREECKRYDLGVYTDFIDFILLTDINGQEVFYRHKIKTNELQSILVENAIDDDAKRSFKSKSIKSMQILINSEKWDIFSANIYKRTRTIRRRRYNDNLKKSEAIIANYFIQNEIDIELHNISRINKFYTTFISKPDISIKNEISKTKEIIDFIINKLSNSDSDFRKINCDQLISSIGNELRNRMLEIEQGDKIKCIEIGNEINGLTLNKIYDVSSKVIEHGILKVMVMNDNDVVSKYNYRIFETITNLRNSALDNILKDI